MHEINIKMYLDDKMLTDWENHRTAHDYDTHKLIKAGSRSAANASACKAALRLCKPVCRKLATSLSRAARCHRMWSTMANHPTISRTEAATAVDNTGRRTRKRCAMRSCLSEVFATSLSPQLALRTCCALARSQNRFALLRRGRLCEPGNT